MININRNFPITYSFAKSKAKALFKFLFDCLKRFIFVDDIVDARVVLGDQAAGLIAAVSDSLPSYKLQHCSWHIAQNIKKRLADKRYLVEERKAIINLVWAYIQSSSEVELDENRAALTASMRAGERDFLAKHWYPRERQFVYIYTKMAPNLGYNSTQ